MAQLDQIRELLAVARDATRHSGQLENITIATHDDAVVVTGNRAGLIELARLVVMVASKDVDGAHQDIDTTHFASTADRMLTIALDTKLR
jgi:hypothetical protein